MRAFLLAAGEGTRMRPLTANRPKHLLPVAGKPLLQHAIEAVRDAGIREMTILTGWQGARVREAFGDGSGLGVRLHYAEQTERKGTAHATSLARTHVDGAFLSVNGDIVVGPETIKALLALHKETGLPVMAAARVEDPSAYGVLDVKDGALVRVVEKPKDPPSDLINAGLYVFDETVFDFIGKTPASPRGEYEITDTLNMMAASGVRVHEIAGDWIDVGQPWDLLAANEALCKRLKGDAKGEVEKGATLMGEVVVAEGAVVRHGAYVQGPVLIGRGADVGPNCFLRPSTCLGERTKVGNACEVKNSIVMDDTHIPHQNYVGDSVLGERCNLGAGTKVANLRLDEKNLRVPWRGREVDTGRRKLGVIMGDDVKVGINASIDAGTIVGEGTFIGPGAVVSGVVAPRSRIH